MGKTLLSEFVQKGWHEKDCPAHTNQMRSEKECTCLYGFVVELLGGKITDL